MKIRSNRCDCFKRQNPCLFCFSVRFFNLSFVFSSFSGFQSNFIHLLFHLYSSSVRFGLRK
ncbi:hypothetical protein Pint_06790 [Pistacia integerrima]|uniref:Uncharacterized protein n=1 Tax=Pistacia integerrima TaxID=434235 RepID=A0ACC0XUW4_9ROSI|nr:hypothetical protein Pint_06790 [Pistacia integerrima]